MSFNQISIQANLPKEIADYLNKMGARIPNIKPGKATIEYLTKIQASTRFWGTFASGSICTNIMCGFKLISSSSFPLVGSDLVGGLLLSILATTSTMLDHYLRHINEGFSIGFTSVLIIVSITTIHYYLECSLVPSLSPNIFWSRWVPLST